MNISRRFIGLDAIALGGLLDKIKGSGIISDVRGRGVVVEHAGLSSRRSRVQVPSLPLVVNLCSQT